MAGIYEVEYDGKVYEVEADSAEEAASTFGPSFKADTQYVDARANTRAQLAGAVAPVFGLLQKGAGLGEGVGILPEGSTEAATRLGTGVQEWIQGAPDEALTESQRTQRGQTAFATEAVLPAAGAAMKIARLGTTGQALVRGAAAGTSGAATHFDSEVSSAWEANLGLGAGALMGAVVGPAMLLPPAIKNRILQVLRNPPTPESAKMLDTLRKSDLWKSAEKRLTLGQSTGDPRIEVQEALVQARRAQGVYNRQLDDAEKRVQRIVETPVDRRTTAEMGEELGQAMHRARVARQQAAGAEYDAIITEAEALAKADPADAFGVKVDNLKAALEANEVGREQWNSIANSAQPQYRKAIGEALDTIYGEGGRLGMGDLMRIHQALNTLRRGLRTAERAGQTVVGPASDLNRLARDIQKGLEKDMDAMTDIVNQARARAGQMPGVPGGFELPGTGYAAAWERFGQARQGYRAHINEEKFFEAQVLEKEFGFNPRDPDAAFRKLLEADPKEQRRMLSLMSPESVQSLKAWKIQDALTRATRMEEQGSLVPLRPDKLIEELTAGRKVAGEDGGLWTNAELQDIKSGVAYLRLIQTRSSVKDKGVELSRAAMAGVSRSAAFVTNIAWRIAANPNIERLLFSAKGREALKALATAGPGSAAFTSAMGYLAAQGVDFGTGSE